MFVYDLFLHIQSHMLIVTFWCLLGYQGAEYVFNEDWGEQEVGIKNPVVVVLDLSTETCSVMDTGEYANISMGQVERIIDS